MKNILIISIGFVGLMFSTTTFAQNLQHLPLTLTKQVFQAPVSLLDLQPLESKHFLSCSISLQDWKAFQKKEIDKIGGPINPVKITTPASQLVLRKDLAPNVRIATINSN
jgi:hypothetical protein